MRADDFPEGVNGFRPGVGAAHHPLQHHHQQQPLSLPQPEGFFPQSPPALIPLPQTDGEVEEKKPSPEELDQVN